MCWGRLEQNSPNQDWPPQAYRNCMSAHVHTQWLKCQRWGRLQEWRSVTQVLLKLNQSLKINAKPSNYGICIVYLDKNRFLIVSHLLWRLLLWSSCWELMNHLLHIILSTIVSGGEQKTSFKILTFSIIVVLGQCRHFVEQVIIAKQNVYATCAYKVHMVKKSGGACTAHAYYSGDEICITHTVRCGPSRILWG